MGAPKSAAKKGAKAKKKKWSKGKVKEKANHAVYFEPEAYEKMLKEIPTGKIITISGVVERLRCSGSLARSAIKELASKGLIVRVVSPSSQLIYTRAIQPATEEEEEEAPAPAAAE